MGVADGNSGVGDEEGVGVTVRVGVEVRVGVGVRVIVGVRVGAGGLVFSEVLARCAANSVAVRSFS
jgi:hypothetical protein